MTTALILLIVAFALFALSIVITACSIVASFARRRAPYTLQAALRYLEEHKPDPLWEGDT